MRVMAQMAMVMNLDKCIGCHTCSVTCKQAWTNRSGTEYVWFNNVETRPGQGYPRTYEDQDRWRGGWMRDKRGRLRLRDGGRLHKLLRIFSNPKLPSIDDYYEPWTYDYENLTTATLGDDFPVARPKSLITGKNMNVCSNSNLILSSDSRRIRWTIGSRCPISEAPARLSSQLADQVTLVSSPVISDLGRATGKSSPSGALVRVW